MPRMKAEAVEVKSLSEGSAPEKVSASSSEGRAVKMAQVHQALHWPGGLPASTTIKPTQGLTMTWFKDGLVLEYRGSRCLVPQANVVNCVLI